MPAPPAVALVPAPARPGDVRLARWRENVGEPVALDTGAGAPPGDPRALVVVSWNLWIGRGRLSELVGRVRAGAFAHLGADPGLPLILLLQEAYRADGSVPDRSNGWGPREIPTRQRPREDIAEAAAGLGLNLRYAPSMRNGAESSDRGNAVLSSLPLHQAAAIELPLEYQRRVAVAATLVAGGRRIRLVSVHLDPRGPIGYKWLGAAGRAVQARHLLDLLEDDTVLLGADLNLGRGRAEPTWRYLDEAGFGPGVPPALPSWTHTYHALPRLVLDYLLVRDRAGCIGRAHVHRLDEDAADRGPSVFGSDHHPLLARVDLR